MNKEDIVTKLKNEADKITLEDRSQKILANVGIIESSPLKKKRIRFIAPFFVGTLSCACVLGLVVFNLSNGVSTPPINTSLSIDQVENTYAMQIVSLVNMAETYQVSNRLKRNGYNKVSDYQSVAEQINDYLYTIEQFNNPTGFDMVLYFTGSDYHMDIKYDVYDYVFTYQEKKDKDEAKISGQVQSGDEIYQVYGSKKEKSGETKIKFTILLNDNEYIAVEQEIENKENEYQYEYYYNNEIVKVFSLEIEKDKTELFLMENQEEIECEFEYEHGKFICSYHSSLGDCEVEIIADGDYYTYSFEDGTKVTLEKK